jgi:SAM-dependent methyltransferase
MTVDVIQRELHEHLKAWGLRRFTSDDEYFAYQRRHFTTQDIAALHQAVERKRQGGVPEEIAFYDLSARPHLIAALYSQRYDYYLEVGGRVAASIGSARSALDVGCGIGLLTTFYAGRQPACRFLGIDRSAASIEAASRHAEQHGPSNVRFECRDLGSDPSSETYDLIIATHAVFQAEEDRGLPSRAWSTFERAGDAEAQRMFELRTGIGARLDRLCAALAPAGRLVLFEKTRLLSRRVPFQRALAGRGLVPVVAPEPVRYRLVEEVTDDGPLYVVARGSAEANWDEAPEPDEGRPLDLAALLRQRAGGDAPLYENHHASAQSSWQGLPERTILTATTQEEAEGRQLHAELGTSRGLVYLYVANTFDRRQLVIVEPARRPLLENYYREIVGGAA